MDDVRQEESYERIGSTIAWVVVSVLGVMFVYVYLTQLLFS